MLTFDFYLLINNKGFEYHDSKYQEGRERNWVQDKKRSTLKRHWKHFHHLPEFLSLILNSAPTNHFKFQEAREGEKDEMMGGEDRKMGRKWDEEEAGVLKSG